MLLNQFFFPEYIALTNLKMSIECTLSKDTNGYQNGHYAPRIIGSKLSSVH